MESQKISRAWQIAIPILLVSIFVLLGWMFSRIESMNKLFGSRDRPVYVYEESPQPIVESPQHISKLEANSINSLNIVDNSISGDDLAVGAIAINNFDSPLQAWIQQVNINLPQVFSLLNDLLSQKLALIQSLEILNGAIDLNNLSPTLAGYLSDLESIINGFTEFELRPGIIEALHIASDAITSSHITDGAVGSLQLALNSVGSNNLIDGVVGSVDLASGAIINSKLAEGAVNGLNIIDGAIGSEDIEPQAINNTLLALNSVTSNTIQNDSITSDDIATAAISTVDIASQSITTDLLANGAVTSNRIANGAVNTTQLALNAVSGANIADGSISASDLANGAIGTAQLAVGSITSGLISDNSIVANDLANGIIGINQLADGSITSAKILNGAIGTEDIASGAIGAQELADGAILTSKLSPAANRRIAVVQVGDIASLLSSLVERPIFIAPTNGTINKITLTNGANISLGINKGTISVLRRTSPSSTVATVDLTETSLSSFVSNVPGLGSGINFSTGDVYSFRYTQGLIGVPLTGFLVTIEYTPTE